MTESATPTVPWGCLAAPDRHPSKGPVALPLFPFDVYRPASTIQARETAGAADSAIQ